MIIRTSKLVLAQVKMLLDKSLMDYDHFSLQPEKTKILQVIRETIDILEP
jgi:hypothetical protein